MENGPHGMTMAPKKWFESTRMVLPLVIGSLMMKKVSGCVKNNIKVDLRMEFGHSMMRPEIKSFNTTPKAN